MSKFFFPYVESITFGDYIQRAEIHQRDGNQEKQTAETIFFFFYCLLESLVGVDWWLRLGVEAAICSIGLVGHAGVFEWHGILVIGLLTEIERALEADGKYSKL